MRTVTGSRSPRPPGLPRVPGPERAGPRTTPPRRWEGSRPVPNVIQRRRGHRPGPGPDHDGPSRNRGHLQIGTVGWTSTLHTAGVAESLEVELTAAESRPASALRPTTGRSGSWRNARHTDREVRRTRPSSPPPCHCDGSGCRRPAVRAHRLLRRSTDARRRTGRSPPQPRFPDWDGNTPRSHPPRAWAAGRRGSTSPTRPCRRGRCSPTPGRGSKLEVGTETLVVSETVLPASRSPDTTGFRDPRR